MRKYDTTKRDKQREETGKSILETSVVHFGKFGYSRTIMRDIARDAGVAYGLINRYYKTKENLLIEVYKYALMKMYRAGEPINTAYGIFMDLIVRTKEMCKVNPDYFLFFKTIMNSSDLPDSFVTERKNLLYSDDSSKLFYAAQECGELPAGDIFGIFQMFLVNMYNLLDMNLQYGLPEPDDKVFLDAIHYTNLEEERARKLQEMLTKAIGDTFEVFSIIDIEHNTGSQIYTGNAVVNLTDFTDIRANLSESINKYICEADRQSVREFLNLDTLSKRLGNQKLLTLQCDGILGKLLHTIIPLEYDATGKLTKFLAGIQIIESRNNSSED